MATLSLATQGVARRCNNAKHVFSNRVVNSAPFEACAAANESFNMCLNARSVIVAAASHPVKRSVKNTLALPAIVKCRGDNFLHSQPNTSNKAAIDRNTCIQCIRSAGFMCASDCTVLSHELYRPCVWRSWPDFSKFDSDVRFQKWRPTLALLVMLASFPKWHHQRWTTLGQATGPSAGLTALRMAGIWGYFKCNRRVRRLCRDTADIRTHFKLEPYGELLKGK
jgi:hypothetical protein